MPLTNTQYHTIMRNYQRQQIENHHLLRKRIEEVYQQCPRLKEIEDTIASVSVEKGKLLLEGHDHALAVLKQELQTLIQEKKTLLNQMGYPSNYFDMPYHCKDCQDTGYIGNEKCHCFKQASLNLIYQQSNVSHRLQEENFSTFSFQYYSSEDVDPATGISSLQCAKNAFLTCQNFVETFSNQFQNLLIYGDTGTGKTFLSNCVAKELLEREYSVIYFTTFELFELFEKATFSDNQQIREDSVQLFDCDLLIIDDLGTELTNSFTTTQLFICLNQRILRKKSTIISTNLSLPQLADLYSERIFSRITSYYQIIKMFGADIRIRKKIEGN